MHPLYHYKYNIAKQKSSDDYINYIQLKCRLAQEARLTNLHASHLTAGLIDFLFGLIDFLFGLIDFLFGLIDFLFGLIDFLFGLIDFLFGLIDFLFKGHS